MTDAKALYDAYHREATSSAVVDKRVSLEIRVMKERLQELGGLLKWMSSDRQIADGLTKEAARGLFVTRLRHHRIKLTWDPSYTAMKKKTKNEKLSALAETTAKDAGPKEPVAEGTRCEHDENEFPWSMRRLMSMSTVTPKRMPCLLRITSLLCMCTPLAMSHTAAPMSTRVA